jgi:hypothetical protein
VPVQAWLEVPGRVLASRARLKAAIGVLAAALAVAAVLLFRLDPAGTLLLPPCPFRALTGIACPGCGSVRALHQLLHGNLTAALDLNALVVLLAPAVAWQLAALGLRALRWAEIWSPLEARWSARAVLVAVLAFWVLRNIDVYPLALLAP